MAGYAHAAASSVAAFPQILGWGHANAGIRFLDKIERSRGEDYVFPHVRSAILDAHRRAGIAGVDGSTGSRSTTASTPPNTWPSTTSASPPPGESWKAVEEV